jgi:hypothetical protein
VKLNSKISNKIWEQHIGLNGFVNLEKDFADISTNIVVNDFPIFTEGKVSFRDAYIIHQISNRDC